MPRKKIIKQEDTGYEYYRTYLNKGIELLDSMSRRHRRIMQTRMDFRYPQGKLLLPRTWLQFHLLDNYSELTKTVSLQMVIK